MNYLLKAQSVHSELNGFWTKCLSSVFTERLTWFD